MVFDHVEEREERYSGKRPNSEVEGKHSGADILVHPGYTRIYDTDDFFEWFNEIGAVPPGGHPQEFYESYEENLRDELNESNDPIIMVYDEGMIEEYREYLESSLSCSSEDLEAILESEPQSGELPENQRGSLQSELDELEDGAELRVHGEQRKCPEEFKDEISQVANSMGKEFQLVDGVRFPNSWSLV